jgi:hypothetical protein
MAEIIGALARVLPRAIAGINASRVIEKSKRGQSLERGLRQMFQTLVGMIVDAVIPDLQFDKTIDGWELVEDSGFDPTITSPSDLELVGFLKGNESSCNGEEMVRRSKDLKAIMSQRRLEWLLLHQNEIPKEWRGTYIPATGTIWKTPDGNRCVACLHWRGHAWCLDFDDLGSGWRGYNRLPRPRE